MNDEPWAAGRNISSSTTVFCQTERRTAQSRSVPIRTFGRLWTQQLCGFLLKGENIENFTEIYQNYKANK